MTGASRYVGDDDVDDADARGESPGSGAPVGSSGAGESEATGERPRQDRSHHGAESEDHPVAGTDGEAPAEAARDEVDEKDHVGHEAGRVQAVLDVERTEG